MDTQQQGQTERVTITAAPILYFRCPQGHRLESTEPPAMRFQGVRVSPCCPLCWAQWILQQFPMQQVAATDYWGTPDGLPAVGVEPGGDVDPVHR